MEVRNTSTSIFQTLLHSCCIKDAPAFKDSHSEEKATSTQTTMYPSFIKTREVIVWMIQAFIPTQALVYMNFTHRKSYAPKCSRTMEAIINILLGTCLTH